MLYKWGLCQSQTLDATSLYIHRVCVGKRWREKPQLLAIGHRFSHRTTSSSGTLSLSRKSARKLTYTSKTNILIAYWERCYLRLGGKQRNNLVNKWRYTRSYVSKHRTERLMTSGANKVWKMRTQYIRCEEGALLKSTLRQCLDTQCVLQVQPTKSSEHKEHVKLGTRSVVYSTTIHPKNVCCVALTSLNLTPPFPETNGSNPTTRRPWSKSACHKRKSQVSINRKAMMCSCVVIIENFCAAERERRPTSGVWLWLHFQMILVQDGCYPAATTSVEQVRQRSSVWPTRRAGEDEGSLVRSLFLVHCSLFLATTQSGKVGRKDFLWGEEQGQHRVGYRESGDGDRQLGFLVETEGEKRRGRRGDAGAREIEDGGAGWRIPVSAGAAAIQCCGMAGVSACVCAAASAAPGASVWQKWGILAGIVATGCTSSRDSEAANGGSTRAIDVWSRTCSWTRPRMGCVQSTRDLSPLRENPAGPRRIIAFCDMGYALKFVLLLGKPGICSFPEWWVCLVGKNHQFKYGGGLCVSSVCGHCSIIVLMSLHLEVSEDHQLYPLVREKEVGLVDKHFVVPTFRLVVMGSTHWQNLPSLETLFSERNSCGKSSQHNLCSYGASESFHNLLVMTWL